MKLSLCPFGLSFSMILLISGLFCLLAKSGEVCALVSSLPLNSFFNHEFTEKGDWSNQEAWSIENSVARIPQNTLIENAAEFPESKDWIIYLKVKTSRAAGSHGHLQIGKEKVFLNLAFDYDWLKETPEPGTLSVSVNDGTIRRTLSENAKTGSFVEIAVHYDSKYSALNFYTREKSTYTRLDSFRITGIAGSQEIQLYSASSGDGGILDVDYLTIAYPNIICIGASITAGHPGSDPNPDLYPAKDPYNHTYQYYVNVYENDRNTLLVSKGVGGQTSKQIDDRIQKDVIDHKPRIAILQPSGNDAKAFTQEQRTRNIQSSIDSMHNAGISVVLFNTIVSNKNKEGGDYSKIWNRDYFPKMRNVDVFVDMMAVLSDKNGCVDAAYSHADGIHPNAEGLALLGDAIEKGIKAHIGRP